MDLEMQENTVSSNRYTTQCQFVKELSPLVQLHINMRGLGHA